MENAYYGTRYLDQVESLGEEWARELFQADYATLKPLSGHIAGLITLLATCDRGDTILTISPQNGGYDGYGPAYLPGMLGLEVKPLPFDDGVWNLDAQEAARLIEDTRPRLVLVGTSFLLFPYDLQPLRRACDDAGSTLAYDGSHVLGLMAGGEFQQPLEEGADILFGSTHKSLFGPQGGMIASRKEAGDEVAKSMVWRAFDNAHWNRIAALTQALGETREFGSEYARMVIANARRLGQELDTRGIPARFREMGFTRSPQLLLDPDALREELGLAPGGLGSTLEKNNIIVDSVGRLGTNEVTRMGAREEDMGAIADLIARAAQGEMVSREVVALRQTFKLSYIFEAAE